VLNDSGAKAWRHTTICRQSDTEILPLVGLITKFYESRNLHASFLFNRAIDGVSFPKSPRRPGLSSFLSGQKSMPLMPPPPAGTVGACLFGNSATIASVVIRRPATQGRNKAGASSAEFGSKSRYVLHG
jgi:hypothetical protein